MRWAFSLDSSFFHSNCNQSAQRDGNLKAALDEQRGQMQEKLDQIAYQHQMELKEVGSFLNEPSFIIITYIIFSSSDDDHERLV